MSIGFDITLLVPGLPFDGATLAKRSLGGSETAGLQMARALARLGHHVTVFSNFGAGDAPGDYDGVTYLPAAQWGAYATTVPHDVAIVQRLPEAFTQRLNSRLNLLWCHDLALGRQAATLRGVLWNLDEILVLSAYMAQQYREVYGEPLPLWVTRNGIDLAEIDAAHEAVTGQPRDRTRLVHAARPERGLDVLLRDVMPRLLAKAPDLSLEIYGYDNAVEHLVPFYAECRRLAEALGDRVRWVGALTKRDLYARYLTSGVYVYPTPSPVSPNFSEISCLTAMEAQACGLPMVAGRRGALPETLDSLAGTLVEPGEILRDAEGHDVGARWTPDGLEAFVAEVLRYTHPTEAQAPGGDTPWDLASAAGERHARALDWSAVAAEWAEHLEAALLARNESPARLVRHAIRRSDILFARDLVPAIADEAERETLATRLERDWGWAWSGPEAFAAHYRQIGETHTDVFDQVPHEPRFQHAEQWLRAHPELERILDYGCAHGGYCLNLGNRVGRTWVGVDVDAKSIEWAERQRQTRTTAPERYRFVEGDHTVDLSGEAPFDAVFAMEVLEHVLDPTAVIDALERWVRPGGRVLITVPYGAWEQMSYATYPHRAHLWHYDRHDLRDLFGAKRDLAIHVMGAGLDSIEGAPIGWHVVEYAVELGRPTGRIDPARKRWLQRPRQTVSAMLIAGPDAEDQLRWVLKPVAQIADEIVIADTGLSAAAKAIAAEFGARLVPSRNPRDPEVGFEGPRNDALAAVRMDFGLWVDTDERLTDPIAVHKYLRENVFHGYSIPQHHMAVDTTFKPDLPVRLFRIRPYRGPLMGPDPEDETRPEIALDGKALRFFGCIHEHPELSLNAGPGYTVALSDVKLLHVGYEVESTRRRRFERNFPLLLADMRKYPTRRLQKHFIIRDWILRARYQLQQTGGVVTPPIRQLCEEACRLYRQFFLGKGTYLGPETRDYYREGLRILGEGVEVAWAIGADRVTAQTNGTMVARFASVEEAKVEILRDLEAKVAPLVAATW